jgi:hypothetical protein
MTKCFIKKIGSRIVKASDKKRTFKTHDGVELIDKGGLRMVIKNG